MDCSPAAIDQQSDVFQRDKAAIRHCFNIRDTSRKENVRATVADSTPGFVLAYALQGMNLFTGTNSSSILFFLCDIFFSFQQSRKFQKSNKLSSRFAFVCLVHRRRRCPSVLDSSDDCHLVMVRLIRSIRGAKTLES